MCGRFYIEPADPEIRGLLEEMNRSRLAERFREESSAPVSAGGEIAPSAVVPVVALNRSRERRIFPMKWGFSLKATDGQKESSRLLINARSETAAEKPMFREAWRNHRCVIPASWYFEWEHPALPDGRKKTGRKYAIHPRDRKMTWLAGLYRMEEGLPVFTILTRSPSEDVRWMHDRMPLMLPEEAVREWISPEEDPGRIQKQALTSLTYQEWDGNDGADQKVMPSNPCQTFLPL